MVAMIQRFKIGPIEFEADDEKAEANLRRHGVSFPVAARSFVDPFARVFPDKEHSLHESRWINVGSSPDGRLLLTAYTLRGERIRLISSRPANRRERHAFEATHS